MVVFALGGVWLDGKYEGVRPLWTVLGSLIGIAVGMTNLIRGILGNQTKKTKS